MVQTYVVLRFIERHFKHALRSLLLPMPKVMIFESTIVSCHFDRDLRVLVGIEDAKLPPGF